MNTSDKIIEEVKTEKRKKECLSLRDAEARTATRRITQ
jgi:hypothetical protein